MSRSIIDFLGVVSPAAVAVAQPAHTDPSLGHSLLPGVAAGVVGATAWKDHRVLGFLAGDTLGLNAYRFYRGQKDDRVRAACNVASSATAIAGSLYWKKHPFYGWVIGFVVGSVATAFVPGSNTHRFATGGSK
jgi:hypothetical protein